MTLLLIEVLYAIKRDLLGFIGSKEGCIKKNQWPKSREEEHISPLRK